jgi:hypothetical protein
MSDIIEPCPKCGQKIRFPSYLVGPLMVTCPPCGHRWEWQVVGSSVVAERHEKHKPPATQMVPVLEFKNTKKFFEELSKEVDRGEPVTVATPFETKSKFPEELKQYIKAGRRDRNSAVGSIVGRPGVVVPSSAAVGALLGLGVGALLGGSLIVVGTGVGTVLGLITGAVSTALSSGSHRIEIVVGVNGKLIIRFNPVSAAAPTSEPKEDHD